MKEEKIKLEFEQGPIRPPSEAASLLIRATRNCPWNRCAFCHTYQGEKFGLRSVEEIKADIAAAAEIAEQIRAISWKRGAGGVIGDEVIDEVFGRGGYGQHFRSVAAWLYYGGKSVFLQDANSLVMKTGELEEVLNLIREKFPFVERITSYCRSKTAARKSVAEFERLRSAGLNRIHIGMETGCDALLDFISKGTTAAEHIEGGKRIRAAGISLCEYVMPGLGGRRWSKENAADTAGVLNEIDPDYIRLRSLYVKRGTALFEKMERGEFEPLPDEDVVREIRSMIGSLEGIGSTIVSDHVLNLLEEIEGRLPEDRERMIAVIDKFLGMTEEARAVFRLGRRRGLYRRLDDLSDRRVYNDLKRILDLYRDKEPGSLEGDIKRLMSRYI